MKVGVWDWVPIAEVVAVELEAEAAVVEAAGLVVASTVCAEAGGEE